MTLPEKILCLADYIEEGRKYPDCVLARQIFWSGVNENTGEAERMRTLDRVLVMSFEKTMAHVATRGGVVNSDTKKALASLKGSMR
jgi:HD superfamily phosphohydrolase YqeK